MTVVPFTVSARTAKLIGMENFSNANGAIIELIKNAYDADAEACVIIFEKIEEKLPNNVNLSLDDTNNEQAENTKKKKKSDYNIYIIDNGSGMTEEILKKQWMTIGTDDKLINFKSDHNRIKTGAKGIGRFALNRLGKKATLFTIPKPKIPTQPFVGYSWKVDWSDFDKVGATINEVTAELETIPSLSLKENLNYLISGKKQIKEKIDELSLSHGTIIKISSLNDSWE